MQQSTRDVAAIGTIYLPVWRSDKDEEENELSSFSLSYFGAAPLTIATDTAPADGANAPAKDGSKEETADGTQEADGLFDALDTAVDGGGRAWSRRLPRQSC